MIGNILHKSIAMRTTADIPRYDVNDCTFDEITSVVDAAKFLKVYQDHKTEIEDVVFIPPVLGSEGFGAFKITYCNGESAEIAEW